MRTIKFYLSVIAIAASFALEAASSAVQINVPVDAKTSNWTAAGINLTADQFVELTADGSWIDVPPSSVALGFRVRG
jgi:hypothetical protein